MGPLRGFNKCGRAPLASGRAGPAEADREERGASRASPASGRDGTGGATERLASRRRAPWRAASSSRARPGQAAADSQPCRFASVEIGECRDPSRVLVEAGDHVVVRRRRPPGTSACPRWRSPRAFRGNRRRSRGRNVDAPRSFCLPSAVSIVRRVRLEPASAAEARLERERPLGRLETEFAREQARRLLAVAVIGIAAAERPARHAVEGQHQVVGPAVPHPVIVHGGGQRADVARIVVERVDDAQPRNAARSRRPAPRTASTTEPVVLAAYCG